MFYNKDNDMIHVNISHIYVDITQAEKQKAFDIFYKSYLLLIKTISDKEIIFKKFDFWFRDLNSGQTRVLEDEYITFYHAIGAFMNEYFAIDNDFYKEHLELYNKYSKVM